MALKSIFSIEVDDTNFKKFKEVFDKYQDALKKLPDDWVRMSDSINNAKDAVGNLINDTENQSNINEKNSEAVGDIIKKSESGAIIWNSMASSIGTVAKHIVSTTSSLAKWSTLTAAFTGLLGAGSLFGIDRLASSISSQRRSAMGLGTTYGQQSAFNTNYSRLINSGSLLSNVSSAKYDITSPGYAAMLSLGIPRSHIQNSDTADLSDEILQKLPEYFRNNNPSGDKRMTGVIAHSAHLDELMPMNDIVAFLGANDSERKRISDSYHRDAKTMGVTDEAQRKWQDLTTQLDRAVRTVETVFMNKLVGIEPGLDHLSDGIVKAIDAFSQSDVLNDWLKAFGGGLDKLAGYIDTPDFQKDVTNFGDFIGKAAQALWDFIASFGGKLPDVANALNSATGQPSEGDSGASSVSTGRANVGGGSYAPPPHIPGGGATPPPHIPGGGATPEVPGANNIPAPTGADNATGNYENTPAGREARIRARAAFFGVDPDFAVAVARAEGLGTHTPNQASTVDVDPRTGIPFSYGDFQLNFRNGLGNESGLNPNDPDFWWKSEDFALRYMHNHGVGPWRGDRAVEAWRSAGRLPTVIVQPNTGANPHNAAYQAATPSVPTLPQ